MFKSNLQDAEVLLGNNLPKSTSYYRNKENITYDVENKPYTTSL